VRDRQWGGFLQRRPVPIVALLLALLGALPAHAQSSAVVARASGVTGNAVLLSPGLAPLALTPGYILNPGDQIDTRGGGRVVIDLSDGSMVVVSPESLVTLKDYRAASTLRELFGITLGMVRVKINHFAGKPNPYRMNSPTASIAVRGTEFTIEVAASGDTQVVVFEGAVEVVSLTNPERRALIEAGRGVLVQGGQDFHLIGANPAPPGGDRAAERNGPQQDQPRPVQQAGNRPPENRSEMPPPSGSGPPPPGNSSQMPAAQPQPGNMSPQSGGMGGGNMSAPVPHADRDRDDTPRATAGTYNRYLAGLADIGQLPFFFRFNAFPEAHLDSLENPAYATEFQNPEGRLFVLPTFRGARTLQEYQSAFGPIGALPSDYSVSPQISYFTPFAGFHLGGSAALTRVGSNTLTASPEFERGTLENNPQSTSQTTGSSGNTYYSGALVASRAFGHNSFGVELAALRGSGTVDSITSESRGPGRLAEERIEAASTVTQTRLTAGFARDLSRNAKLGLFYRYAFIRSDDHDVSHTMNNFQIGLNSTLASGHSSEVGMRLRGLITPRLSYGFAAAWLGISLQDGLARITTVDSHQRDRAQRGSMAAGLGYALSRTTTLTFDLAGGVARTWASRTEDATGALLQNAVADSHFISGHAAIQTDVTRRLFLTASLLNIWQVHNLNVSLFPDRFGNRTSVETAFFPLASSPAQYAPRFSDFGIGWRFTRDLFAQYVYTTDFGRSSATHTLMLRYTFGPRD